MSDLVAFLRARLDEDEWAALEITQAPDAAYSATWDLPFSATIDIGDDTLHTNDQRVARHVARWDPARVLAEIEAKRRIVEAHSPAPEGYLQHHRGWNLCRSCYAARPYRLDQVPVPCGTLKLLALPYADHPDFDPAWRLA